MQSLRQCMTAALDGERSPPPLVVVVSPDGFAESGSWAADGITPGEWPREVLNDNGLSWADSPPTNPRILLVAPYISTREIGIGLDRLGEDGWRTASSLAGALLLRAVLRAQQGQRIATLAASSAFASSHAEPRRRLIAAADVCLVAESDGEWAHWLGMHSAYRLSLFCFERRAVGVDPGPSRFLRVPRQADTESLTRELRVLLRQGGGRTDHGYVVRERLDAARPIQYAAFDPLREDRQSALRSLGDVRPLGDLVTIVRGAVNRTVHANALGDAGVPVLAGRDLHAASLADLELTRITRADEDALLRAGDICVAAITRPGERLRVRRIVVDDLPMVADHHLVVLRPVDALTQKQLDFLVEYLRSERAAALLTHVTTGGPHLRIDQLRELPVPVPDETLLSALSDLCDTQQQLTAWASEVDGAVAGVLADTTDDSGILQLRSEGQLLRQRVAAARQLDDLGYRVRNLFPFPVALPWLRAMTASEDLEGYQGILECAESLTAYLAALSVVLARHLHHALGSVRSLREKLAGTPHGTSMSD